MRLDLTVTSSGGPAAGTPAVVCDTETGGSPSEVDSIIVFAASRTATTVALVAASCGERAGIVIGVVELSW